MGSSINSSYPSNAPDDRASDQRDEDRPELGDLLAGRLSDVNIDSVAAVREEREQG